MKVFLNRLTQKNIFKKQDDINFLNYAGGLT